MNPYIISPSVGKIAQLRACKCPACGKEHYTAGLKAHILATARKECLNLYLEADSFTDLNQAILTAFKKKLHHAEFVRKNMVRKIVS